MQGKCRRCGADGLVVHSKSGWRCVACIDKKDPKRKDDAFKKERGSMLKAWNELPKECAECQTWVGGLGEPMNPYNMAHIVSKGSAPQFRHDIRNLIKLCKDCHYQYDFGDRKSMKIYAYTRAIKDELYGE